MSFLTALLDQQASKTQPDLPTGSDTKTAFRLPASKSLPALKPSASSSSLQAFEVMMERHVIPHCAIEMA